MHRPFAKYEGLGNDFVILDAAKWPRSEITPALARALCDRHRGIGADGVLWVQLTGTNAATMVVLNADGSRPEMCGNGARCVGAWLADDARLSPGETLALTTDAGARPLRVLEAIAGGVRTVDVDMGTVRANATAEVGVVSAGRIVRVFAMDAGNPHAIVFDDVAADGRMAVVAALEGRTDVFPHGVNVEFARKLAGDAYEVHVHERGVGWTNACGTGACAVAAAATSAAGAKHATGTVTVTFTAGTLRIAVETVGTGEWRTRMQGPARGVFRGVM